MRITFHICEPHSVVSVINFIIIGSSQTFRKTRKKKGKNGSKCPKKCQIQLSKPGNNNKKNTKREISNECSQQLKGVRDTIIRMTK